MLLAVRLTTAINSPLICSLACTACKPVALTCMLWWNINTGRAADTQWLCFNVVLMHALKVAVLLNVRCFFDPCLHEFGVQTFSRTFSGRFDIRPGVPPPPRSCCSQQVAGFQMCQPIFINISNFFLLSCSTTECVAMVIVDFPFVECLYFYCLSCSLTVL